MNKTFILFALKELRDIKLERYDDLQIDIERMAAIQAGGHDLPESVESFVERANLTLQAINTLNHNINGLQS